MRQPTTLEEYDRLGEHLYQIDPLLKQFAADHGYTAYSPLSGGRYPNRRISQEGPVHRTIHISMSDKPNGDRYCAFFPEIPYTIFGSVCIDDKQNRVRWHSASLVTRNIPFGVLVASLHIHLNHFHAYISSVTEEYVYSVGCKSSLG